MSPHEAGFTEIGLFVPTPLLGSKFQKGELLEQKPEMDMIRLLGQYCDVRSVRAATTFFFPLIVLSEWKEPSKYKNQYKGRK